MALISVDDFRTRFDIESSFEDDRLAPHIAAASRRLQKWVTADTYATTDAGIKAVLQNAEAHLAMHYAILGFNTAVSAKGVLMQARSSEAGGREIRTYMPPEDTQKIAQQFLDLAQEMVADLAINDGTPSVPFDIVASSDCEIDTSCEAVTRVRSGRSCR